MLEYLTKARHSETAVQSKVEESRLGSFRHKSWRTSRRSYGLLPQDDGFVSSLTQLFQNAAPHELGRLHKTRADRNALRFHRDSCSGKETDVDRQTGPRS